jgi:ketosteroid isomerase-like protein
MRKTLPFLFVLSVLSACAPTAAPAPAAPPAPDLAAEERDIREVDARWIKAAQAHDIAGEAAVLAADAVFFREHVEPIVGPAAFQTYFGDQLKKNPKVMPSWTTDNILVAASGDLAVQVGSYSVTGLGAKGDGEDKGKFVTVWKKVGGEWKVLHDIGNTTMPEK